MDLSQEEISDLFQTVVRVQRVMETEQKTMSTTVCVQDGPLAGQTMPVSNLVYVGYITGQNILITMTVDFWNFISACSCSYFAEKRR